MEKEMDEHIGYIKEKKEDVDEYKLYLRRGNYIWKKGGLTLPTTFKFDRKNYMMIIVLDPPSVSYVQKTF